MNDSLSKTWLQYEAGRAYKRQISLYHTVRENERFYRGDQWYAIDNGNLPKPVFNVVKRVVDYLICSVVPQKVVISYSDENTPYLNDIENSARTCKILTENARYRWEKSRMDAKLYRLASDAAISGDGVLYCYWKNDAFGDGKYIGDVQTDVIDNVNVFVSDVNKNDIQTQDYIILSGRAGVISLRQEARENGVSDKEVLKIVADDYDGGDYTGGYAFAELEGQDEEKATYLIKFWREDGVVCFEKSTRNCVINRVKTPCTLYPVAYFNWSPRKNSFHGASVVSGMINNQKYINRAYAMVMKHMSDTAFSKVVYDKSKIPEWSNEVGEAIAAIGATNVSDAVSILGVGKLQEDYLEFLQSVVSSTKEMNGATETALGNVNPQNTSAILAIQAASQIPLKVTRAALYQCIEDLANIWADMILSYFASERLVPMLNDKGECVSSCLETNGKLDVRMSAAVTVTDAGTYNSSIVISILDKLLDKGYINVDQYLDKISKLEVGIEYYLTGGVENDGY